MQSQKLQNDLCSFPRQTFNITVIQAYAPTSNSEEAEAERFYEDPEDLLGLTLKKMSFSFHFYSNSLNWFLQMSSPMPKANLLYNRKKNLIPY